MTRFGNDLIRALREALAHAKGQGPAVVHTPVTPREIRKQEKQSKVASSLSDGPYSPRVRRKGDS